MSEEFATERTMNIVVATGCPYSGWDVALPALKHAGLQSVDEAFARWQDELFGPDGMDASLQDMLVPDAAMAHRAAALLGEISSAAPLLADSRNVWLLDFWAGQLPSARFVLFYTNAETALANALLNDADPSRFLKDWQKVSRAMLRFRRRNRQRALLVDAEAAALNPQALIDVCRHIGLTLQPPDQWPASVPVPPVFERLVSRHLLAEQPAVQELQVELKASAYPLRDSVSEAGLSGAELYDSYRSEKREILELRQNLQEVIAQRKIAAQALEQAEKQKNELQKTFQFQLAQAEKAKRELEVTRQEMVQENELLLLQLHQVQEELEHYFLKYQELELELTKKDSEIAAQRERVAELERSGFWTIAERVRDALAKPFRRSNKEREKLLRQVDLVRGSGLFDEAWYLTRYEDVAKAGCDPVEHYLKFGAAEGRNPSPRFDTQYYLESNPDVAAAGVNPLVHFVKFGRVEGRRPIHLGNAA